MKLDVDTLGTFYEMAREGAGLAARRLTAMTDIETRVGVTRLHFTNPSYVRADLDEGAERVGVRVALDGGLAGTSLVLFDRESAVEATNTLVADVPDRPTDELARSAIAELCHIMNSGFVDGWADVLRAEIDVSTPVFVRGNSSAAFLKAGELERSHDELAMVFRNEIEAVDKEFGFEHYLVPRHESVATLFEPEEDGDGIEYEKLAGFDHMAQKGAEQIAENLTRMTGIEMAVDIRRINFISLDAIPEAVANETRVSVAFSFDGMPGGYLLFLFEPQSAAALIEATVGRGSPQSSGTESGDGFDAFQRDAIQELSNVMTSGLLDGWANMLDTTIDHSTPAYTYDMGAAVVDPLIVGLSRDQEFAFVFDTRIEAVNRAFDIDIYAIPDEADLERALKRLDGSRLDESPTSAEFPSEMDADLLEELAEESAGNLLVGDEQRGSNDR